MVREPTVRRLTRVKSFRAPDVHDDGMRARTNFIIDAVVLAGYAMATNPAATGTPVHEWLSIAVALVAFVHLVVHWDWVTAAVHRLFGALGTMSRANLVLDCVVLVAGVTTALSGLMVSRSALAIVGYVAPETGVWHRVHAEASTLLLVGVGLHLGMHWDWAVAMWRQHVIKPLRTPKAATRPSPRATTAGARSPQALPWLRRTAASLALVGAVAFGVWTAAPRLEAGFGWLALSGRTEIVEPAEATAPRTAPATGTAASFEGNRAERTGVRAGHSLLLLALATLSGTTLADLVRKS